MPRSRNSRSASPQKSVSAESLVEFERIKTLKHVHDIFQGIVDADVIRLVLQECCWKEEEAVEKLLMIAESREEQTKYKSKLHSIAEGVFGSLRSEDYGSKATASSLSASEKVIRRPSKPATNSNKGGTNTSRLHNVGSSEQLLARGLAPTLYSSGNQDSGNSAVDEIEMDLHFPQLPTRSSETNLSSTSSSVGSQKSSSGQAKSQSSSKTVLLSQAQSAFNQQFDDAEGTQRWEKCKQRLSEHYLVNLTKEKPGQGGRGQSPGIDSKQTQSFPDDPAILQAELESPRSDTAVPIEIDRPKSETSRNFPVRLLSRSPDSHEEDVKVPVLISGQNAPTRADINELMTAGTVDSGDLDETVFKCIYEVHGDLLDEKELGRRSLSQKAVGNKAGTPTLNLGPVALSSVSAPTAQQSNEAMTLPTIGLSVNAVEFVPRPKSTVATSASPTQTDVVETSPQPTSRMTMSTSIEIKSGVKNFQKSSTSRSLASPLSVSPSISPGLSPPTTLMNSPVANLTGSPMFITPKGPHMYHPMNPPPSLSPSVLASTTARYVSPNPTHHLSPAYRFQQTGPLPYSSRMVYSVAPPPMFRMAGMPRYVQQPGLPVGENIEERAAIATGQPIMATSESSRLMFPPPVTVFNQNYIEQKEKIQKLQKSGLKVLIIVRGLPGSGKTTLARALQLGGIVLSTDDYFMKGNRYDYNPEKLTEAHQWNRERSKEAMKMGKSPVIIDNTNTQTWEFKPYVSMALTYNYHIELLEPNTPWKYKASELARRTLHGVPKDQIERMCNRYEHNISVETLIRKRKADTKTTDVESTEVISEITTKLDKSSPTSTDDVPASRITDSRSKELKLQNFSKGDDFRKQRSAESDSDSISSFQSGSLSNQSSRNASPKPLRPSLKTPGALQKMEKLKPPVITKPAVMKHTVKKVQKKAIKQIESKLSEETVLGVNELISEHAGDRILSADDVTKLEEELKALLFMLYPVNESEVSSAEELIGLKLHDIINQTAEIPEAEDDAEEENNDEESAENISNDEIKFEIPFNTEIENVITKTETEDKGIDSLNSELSENNLQNKDSFEEKDIGVIESDIKNEFHNDKKAMQSDLKITELETSEPKRVFPSWTDIANVKTTKHLNVHSSYDKLEYNYSESMLKVESDLSTEGSKHTVHTDFESQYWGEKIVTETTTLTHWDDDENSDWSETNTKQSLEMNSEKNRNGAKPQRKKRNRSSDTTSDEINSPTDETIQNDNELTEKIDDNEIFIECTENLDELDKEKERQFQNGIVMKINERSDEETCLKETNKDIELNVHDVEQKNEIEETICSNTDIDRSHNSIHESSHQNSSLQMLQESYIDTESAIIVGKEDAVIAKESDGISSDINNDTEAGKSDVLDKRNSTDQKSFESLTLTNKEKENIHENKSSNSLTNLESDSETLREVLSNESLNPSEESEVEFPIKCEPDIELNNQISQKSLTPSSSQKSKKPSRRKMAANLGPFLNNEDKEKFKTASWNSFQKDSPERSPSSVSNIQSSNGRDVVDAMTVTDIEYFNIVLKLNQGGFVESNVRYLTGNPRKLINRHNASEDITSVSEIHTLEKSTSTDDFVTLTDTESVEFLQTCFPTVPIGELECVLEICANNVEWAIDLLLDWKYSLNLTEDEKKKFAEGMAGIKKAPSPETVESSLDDIDSGPSSLLDICLNLVEQEHIAPREEIEKQLIQTGKERLDRIEGENISKIRLRRSTSLSESSFDIGSFTPNKNDLTVFRSNSSPSQIRDNDLNDAHGLDKDSVSESVALSGDDELNTEESTQKNSQLEMGNEVEKQRFGAVNDLHEESHKTNHVDTDEFDFGLKPAVSVDINTEMIGKLEDMFGPIGNRSDVKDNLSVPLDRKTAWLMYQCVKKGMIMMRSQQRQEQQQLRKDEELARQLQEEENAYIKPGTRSHRDDSASGFRGRKTTPLVGLSVLGTIPQQKEPVAWNSGHKSLAEIMQEEQRIQESQQEFIRLVEKEGGHTAMATCLKRQKLYGRFPKLDKKVLDEIFQANCFNFGETVAAISTSLDESYSGTTSVTMAQHDVLSDQKLLEATKQESLHDMLDSYIYHPVPSKDFQDGAEPEYEDYRGEASLHYRLRHECFQKAREAHSRGLKQVATFYSQQGHQHTQKIKEANMRASEQILAERNHDIERNMTLDLHGLHVDEAIAALNRIIPQKERDRCKKLTVITGRGSHSRGGVARLRPSVITYLTSNKYNFTEIQTGVFSVSLKYRT